MRYKYLIGIVALIFIGTAIAAQSPPISRVLLMWDNPIQNRTNLDSANIVYRVWTTNQLSNLTNSGTTNWSLLTTLPNNTNATNMGVIFNIDPSTANFFSVSASNFFEVFSTNVRTPPYPSALLNLRISLTN